MLQHARGRRARIRPTRDFLIVLIAIATLAFARNADAQPVFVTVNPGDPAVTSGSFDAGPGLANVGVLSGTGTSRQYHAVPFTAAESRNYILGMNESSVDTVMILYGGSGFDPASPASNVLALNDDTAPDDHRTAVGDPGLPVSCFVASFCPQVTIALNAGETVELVITSFGASDAVTLPLPLSFYSDGPGAFSTETDTDAPTVNLESNATSPVSGPFVVTITFSEPVTGFSLSDVVVTGGTASNFSGADAVYTVDVAPDAGASVSVDVPSSVASDAAGNANVAAETLVVQLGTPASEFAEKEEDIRSVVVDAAQRTLNATLAANRRLASDARTRFINSQDDGSGEGSILVSRNDVPFDVDGVAQASNGVLSTSGSFFGQRGDFDGTQRRLFFGDFDFQYDSATGSTTGTVSGKLAWERSVSASSMVGYYIGAEVAKSEIGGTFDGAQTMYGASIGAYFVSALQDNLFVDGFASFGVGQNQLSMSDGVLDLESNYLTQTGTVGTALTGVIQRGRYEIWPELAFTYGKTFIGTTTFEGAAYGLVDSNLLLEAGNMSVANLTLRTEFRVPMDGRIAESSNLLLTFAPRFICEQVVTTSTVQSCGGGAELGISSATRDGLGQLNAKLMLDQVGDSTRTGLELNLEHRF